MNSIKTIIKKANRLCPTLIGLVSISIATARADLLTPYTWPYSFAPSTFVGQLDGQSYTFSSASPTWQIAHNPGDVTWMFSLKGTGGDFYLVRMDWINGGLYSLPYNINGQSTYKFYIPRDDDGDSTFWVLAHRTSGGSPITNPEMHGCAIDINMTNILDFDNVDVAPSTFFLGTKALFNGLPGYCGKYANGSWSGLGLGIDNPNGRFGAYVDAIYPSHGGTCVYLEGSLDRGYNADGSTVYATTFGQLFYLLDSPTTGHWSNTAPCFP